MVAAIAVTCLSSSMLAKETKEEIPIPIVLNSSNIPGNDGGPRSSVDLIRAYYDDDFSCVYATLSNAGVEVEVEFVNHTTNETDSYVIPGTGSSILPISGTSGYWTITFILADGSVYVGNFVI